MLEDILESVFALSLLRNSPNFEHCMIKQLIKTPSLASIHPAGGVDISAWRGVDCLLQCWAFGNAPKQITRQVSTLSFIPNYNRLDLGDLEGK